MKEEYLVRATKYKVSKFYSISELFNQETMGFPNTPLNWAIIHMKDLASLNYFDIRIYDATTGHEITILD